MKYRFLLFVGIKGRYIFGQALQEQNKVFALKIKSIGVEKECNFILHRKQANTPNLLD